VLLLSFPPTIGLARIVGLGIEIGWVLVGRARMRCLLWSVGVGVVEICLYMVVLTPLWYRNEWGMICVSLLCRDV